MGDPFTSLRYVLGLFVVFSTLSFTLGVVDGQPVGNSEGPPRGIVKQITGLKKNHARFRAALAATRKHARRLLSMSGVVATGTGIGPDGEPMVKVFTAITTHGVGNPTVLAGGIAEALITTAAGLTVAIPALIGYRYYRNRVDTLVVDMEKEAIKLVEALHRRQAKA